MPRCLKSFGGALVAVGLHSSAFFLTAATGSGAWSPDRVLGRD